MSEKLEELEEKQSLERWELLTDEAKQKQRDHALFILGGIQVADKIANSISSQAMNALILFQKENLYRHFGFDRFADFLDKSEYSLLTKHQFYERKKIFDAEGEEIFDLLNEVGVSVKTRKMLANGSYQNEISIENGKLKIGDEEADLSNARLVRTVIETYADDLRQLTEKTKKQQEKVEKLEKNIATGQKEFDELRRSIDADKDRNPYDKAYLNLLIDLGNLTELAKTTNLDDSRRDADIRSVFGQMIRYRDALKPNFVLLDEQPNAPKSQKINPKIAALLSEDDDWGDELEQ